MTYSSADEDINDPLLQEMLAREQTRLARSREWQARFRAEAKLNQNLVKSLQRKVESLEASLAVQNLTIRALRDQLDRPEKRRRVPLRVIEDDAPTEDISD